MKQFWAPLQAEMNPQLLTVFIPFLWILTFASIIKSSIQALNQDLNTQRLHPKCRRRYGAGQSSSNRFSQLRLCDRYIQGTSQSPSPGDGGFEIRISTNGHDNYVPGEEYDGISFRFIAFYFTACNCIP